MHGLCPSSLFLYLHKTPRETHILWFLFHSVFSQSHSQTRINCPHRRGISPVLWSRNAVGYCINNLPAQKYFQLLNNMPERLFFSSHSFEWKESLLFIEEWLLECLPLVTPPDCCSFCWLLFQSAVWTLAGPHVAIEHWLKMWNSNLCHFFLTIRPFEVYLCNLLLLLIRRRCVDTIVGNFSLVFIAIPVAFDWWMETLRSIEIIKTCVKPHFEVTVSLRSSAVFCITAVRMAERCGTASPPLRKHEMLLVNKVG